MPQRDANLLPLLMTPSPTGSECSIAAVADRVMHCRATMEQEPADGLTLRIPPAPIIALYDNGTSNKHTSTVSSRPLTSRRIRAVRSSVPSRLIAHAVELAWRRLCSIVIKAGILGEKLVDLIRHAAHASEDTRQSERSASRASRAIIRCRVRQWRGDMTIDQYCSG